MFTNSETPQIRGGRGGGVFFFFFFFNSIHKQYLKQCITQCTVGYWTSLSCAKSRALCAWSRARFARGHASVVRVVAHSLCAWSHTCYAHCRLCFRYSTAAGARAHARAQACSAHTQNSIAHAGLVCGSRQETLYHNTTLTNPIAT